MSIIAPSILSADFANIESEIKAAEAAGADWIHIDVMDGRFVPNLTIGPPIVEAMRRCTELPLDVHLMIVEPERWIEAFADAGADHIAVHPEACVHLDRTLQAIRDLGKKAGVALNPSTHENCLEYVVEKLDQVLVMTVNPGFGGQQFLTSQVDKIQRIGDMLKNAGQEDVLVGVDGGIDPNTIGSASQAGASYFVAGNAVFNQDDYGRAIQNLRIAC